MKLLIIPKPVLDNELAIMSYCFRFQRGGEFLEGGQHPARRFEGVINLPCLTVLEEVGLNGFTNGMPLFVPLNKFALLSDVSLQCTQPPDKIVFLLDAQVPPEEPFLSCIKSLRKLGYRFAIENVTNYTHLKPVIDLCEFILISFRYNQDGVSVFNEVSRQFRKHQFIASDVNDAKLFERIKHVGFDCFEGRFYSIPVTRGHNTIAPVKVNRIQLMNIVREPDFAIEEVVKVVRQDPSLSISLLRLVNSPYIGLSQKIKSIQHAVALLGQVEVRKWVTTATSGLLAEDRPDELTRLSLVRAKFAENLAPHFEMAIHSQSLFLMGLFSILDVVLEMPMAKALEIVSVSEPIMEALVFLEGDFGKVFKLILSYEAADWNEVNRQLTLSNVHCEDLYAAYIDTVRWYDAIAQAEEVTETDLED